MDKGVNYYFMRIGDDYYKTAAADKQRAKDILKGYFNAPDAAIEVKEVTKEQFNMSARRLFQHQPNNIIK